MADTTEETTTEETMEETTTEETTEETTTEETTEESSEDSEEETETSKTFRAKRYILYESRQYKPGEALPTNNAAMMALWIENGVAAWVEDADTALKAAPKTAEPGLAGEAAVSEAEDGVDLVGKVPSTGKRKKKS